MSSPPQPEPRGRVFEIQRFSIHDGPGIRTTVFLQGCTLACLWCHNPEGGSSRPVLSFQPDKCVACGWCVSACPEQAHHLDVETGTHTLDRDRCRVCGACTEQCYSGALEVVGRDMGVGEVLQGVLADIPFYETSDGGMTLSGGEPLAQLDFAAALLQGARHHGLHTALETCGSVPLAHLERILPWVDLFLYDIKESAPERHREFTGGDGAPIIANLRYLHGTGAAIRLRLPLIPTMNDRPDHLDGVAELVHELPGLEGVEIMPYHRLGTSKMSRFGWPQGPEFETPDDAMVEGWITALGQRGVTVRNR